MTRYSALSPVMPFDSLVEMVTAAGAVNIYLAQHSKIIFCDLSSEQVRDLRSRGISLKPVCKVHTTPIVAPPEPAPTGVEPFTLYNMSLSAAIWEARHAFDPPLAGKGYHLAILDTGIRKTHEGFKDQVVYEEDFTGSGHVDDIFDHGTGVAFMAAGGQMVEGIEQGIAPETSLLSLKVLNDMGEGSEETVVKGIERCIELRETGLIHVDMANLSLGTPDDGNPDNPIRVACREAIRKRILIFAAAGNFGPEPGSVMIPAVDPIVIAVGALHVHEFSITPFSGRGPTIEGNIKPDLVFFGSDLYLASSKSDRAYRVCTGTSFATPGIAGISILCLEGAHRYMGKPVEVPGVDEPITPLPGVTIEEILLEMFPRVSVRPQDAPLGKDNNYGFGLPMGNLINNVFQYLRPPSFSQMMIPAIEFALTVGIVGMIGQTVVKESKRG